MTTSRFTRLHPASRPRMSTILRRFVNLLHGREGGTMMLKSRTPSSPVLRRAATEVCSGSKGEELKLSITRPLSSRDIRADVADGSEVPEADLRLDAHRD